MKAWIGASTLAVALALGVAGCGGSSGGESVAHLETSTAPTTTEGAEPGGEAATGGEEATGGEAGAAGEDKALAYSECMRSNGISDFPEPVEGRIQLQIHPGSDLDPESPAFQKAEEACRALAPSQEPGGAQESELQSSALEFSECMRSHGVSNFPDPQVSEGHMKMTIPPGIDPESSTFVKAQEACRDLLAGGPAIGEAP